MSENLENKLNSKQKEVFFHEKGPLLVLAGAGSGKTRAITYRMAHLILSKKANPEQILGLTFTNKAAKEMGERVFNLLKDLNIFISQSPPIYTFHSFCAQILRSYIHLIGYDQRFVIYDDKDQLELIKKIIKKFEMSEQDPKENKQFINYLKRKMIFPDEVKDKLPYSDEQKIKIYTEYERILKNSNAVDFGGLLLNTLILFKKSPEVLKHYQNLFKYVMIDEFQDTNFIQYEIIKKISIIHKNLCVVGDEDQSIYAWRGADIRNILEFEKNFSPCKIVKFEQNYRSSKNIVEASSHLIQNNTERKDKKLFTHNEMGSLIEISEYYNDIQESKSLSEKIKELKEKGNEYSDCAIFYRTNAQSRLLEDSLRSDLIPYKIIGSISFYERKEVKDMVSYMKLISNPKDDIAFKRAIQTPKRGIGKTSLENLEKISDEQNLSLMETIHWIKTSQTSLMTKFKKFFIFYEMIEKIREISEKETCSEVYFKLLEETQYIKYLEEKDQIGSEQRVENLEELANVISQYEQENEEADLFQFLEEIILRSEVNSLKDKENGLSLMTLHLSKGLEFDHIFIAGCEEGIFPSLFGDEDEEKKVEEERRLMYVGMTRARKNLHISYCTQRKIWGKDQFQSPSRFIDEIPEKFLKRKKSKQFSSFKKTEDFYDYEDDNQEEYSSIKVGAQVKHPVFGKGRITYVEGEGSDQKIKVLFFKGRERTFLVEYAQLEII